MNAYLDVLEDDVSTAQGLSRICRGEWCRFLEMEVDGLQNELEEFRLCEGDFQQERIQALAIRIRDAYKHLRVAAVL